MADYGSDFTDSDDDFDTTHQQFVEGKDPSNGTSNALDTNKYIYDANTQTLEKSESTNEPEKCNISTNCFDENDDDESDSDQESPELSVKQDDSPSTAARLPNPLVGIFTSEEDKNLTTKHSVFSSEYEHLEAAKRSVLEKHVKLTDDEIEKRRNRPICNKFKNGKCRFGVRCKFSHDVNQAQSGPTEDASQAQETSAQAPKVFSHQPKFLKGPGSIDYMPEPVDDDSYMGQFKRKRRYGVTDTLRPPKKALNDLDRHRHTDRPWTVNNLESNT